MNNRLRFPLAGEIQQRPGHQRKHEEYRQIEIGIEAAGGIADSAIHRLQIAVAANRLAQAVGYCVGKPVGQPRRQRNDGEQRPRRSSPFFAR